MPRPRPLLLLLLLMVALCASAGRPCPPDAVAPMEQRVRNVPLVFRGLAVQAEAPLDQNKTPVIGEAPNNTAQFWIITVYKGSRVLAEFFNLDQPGTDAVDIKDR